MCHPLVDSTTTQARDRSGIKNELSLSHPVVHWQTDTQSLCILCGGKISWLYSKEMEIMLMNTASHRTTWSSVLIYLLHKHKIRWNKLSDLSFSMTNDASCIHVVLRFPNHWIKCGGSATSVVVNTACTLKLTLQTMLVYKLFMCYSDLISCLLQKSGTFSHDRHMFFHRLKKVPLPSIFLQNISFTLLHLKSSDSNNDALSSIFSNSSQFSFRWSFWGHYKLPAYVVPILPWMIQWKSSSPSVIDLPSLI